MLCIGFARHRAVGAELVALDVRGGQCRRRLCCVVECAAMYGSFLLSERCPVAF